MLEVISSVIRVLRSHWENQVDWKFSRIQLNFTEHEENVRIKEK